MPANDDVRVRWVNAITAECPKCMGKPPVKSTVAGGDTFPHDCPRCGGCGKVTVYIGEDGKPAQD